VSVLPMILDALERATDALDRASDALERTEMAEVVALDVAVN